MATSPKIKLAIIIAVVISILLVVYMVLEFTKEIVIPDPTGNNPPKAYDNSVSTNEETAIQITLTGSDEDGDTLTYSINSGPSKGVLSGTAPNLSYKPNDEYNGLDSFRFLVSDGKLSDDATVSITVTPINDPPKDPPGKTPPKDPPGKDIPKSDESGADLLLAGFITSEGFRFYKSTVIPPFKFEVPAATPFYYYSTIENINKDVPVSNVCVKLEILNKEKGIFLNLTQPYPKFGKVEGTTPPILPDIPPIICVELDEITSKMKIAHPIKLDLLGIHLSYHTVTYYDETLKMEIAHERIMNELIVR